VISYASWTSLGDEKRCEGSTYNGYFSTKLVLNFSFFVGIWALLPNYGEELFDTHCGGILS
jgi:LPS sulfotransferase NodH